MSTPATFQQSDRGFMTYPQSGWRKAMFRAPLYLWRMGLGFLLPRQMLVLTTTGRKSGLPRYTMVEHFDVGGTIYVVSGWGKQAQWLKNIEADPIATVETVRRSVLRGTFQRVIDADELRTLWEPMSHSPMFGTQLDYWEMAPTLEDFLAKRERAVILRLDPGDVAAPPPLERDLQWVPFMIAGLLLTRLLKVKKRVK